MLFSSQVFGQNIEVVNFHQLEQNWNNTNDTLYVINYWATWCKPCVEELPDFIKLEKEMQSKKFKMILVSLDFPSHLDTRVLPFIQSNNISTEVVILKDDPNVWINKVNQNWDGAIPATQFIKNKQVIFYGEQLNFTKLKGIVNEFN